MNKKYQQTNKSQPNNKTKPKQTHNQNQPTNPNQEVNKSQTNIQMAAEYLVLDSSQKHSGPSRDPLLPR